MNLSYITSMHSRNTSGLMKNNEMSKAYFQQRRPEMLKFVPKSAVRILDVGCGAGDFAEMLKVERKAEVWGIELIPVAAQKAARKLDRVFTGNIEDDEMALPDEYFDCIICNDVLEHMVDPWRVLRRLRPKLSKKGAIVASIPNIRFYLVMKELLLLKEWEYKDQGVLDRTHLRFFTIKSIRSMFDGSGYRVEVLEGINKYRFSWKFRLINKIFFGSLDDMFYEQFACVARANVCRESFTCI